MIVLGWILVAVGVASWIVLAVMEIAVFPQLIFGDRDFTPYMIGSLGTLLIVLAGTRAGDVAVSQKILEELGEGEEVQISDRCSIRRSMTKMDNGRLVLTTRRLIFMLSSRTQGSNSTFLDRPECVFELPLDAVRITNVGMASIDIATSDGATHSLTVGLGRTSKWSYALRDKAVSAA